ncbi:MAG: acyltransferase family protein [Oleispira sp.]|nr:acyltransferase family protein [Oleispira sp.]
MTSENYRFEWVDYAKAIGILLVVYGHVARGLVSAGIMPDSIVYRYVDSVIYTFHMPLFFFLSGLFLISSFQSKGFGRVFGSKIDTIVYPYIIWSLLQGGVEVVLSSYTNASVTVYDVVSLLSSPRAQFWFLYALFLVFSISLFVLKFVGVKALYFSFILSVVFYLWSPKLDFNMNFISANLVFFLAGAVFQQTKLILFNASFVVGVVSILAIAGQYLFHKAGYTYENKGLFLLGLSVLSLLAIVSLSEWLSRYNLSFVAYVGASSMAIYLMHILAGSGARVIVSKVLGVDLLSLHLLLGTLLGMILPLLALKVIKYFKIPHLFSFPISHYWLGRADKNK